MLCFNSTTPEHQAWYKVGKSPFPWWMGAGPVGWEFQPCRCIHLQLFTPYRLWVRGGCCRKRELFLSLSGWVPVLAEISAGLPSQYFSASVLQGLCPGPEAVLLPHVPGPSPFHPWPPSCVREGSAAATEANQRNFLPVRAEKVHDGFFCPHFQLCLEV